jgi:hypothetical protein
MSQDYALFPHELKILSGIIIMLAIGLGYQALVLYPEYDHKTAIEKSSLDSMACQSIGKWIIDHSENQTRNYPYAQAKYLVCTHGGTSP